MQFSTFPMMMMVGWAFAFIYNQVHINIKVWTWRGKVCIPKLSQISINGCSSKIIYTTSNILCTRRKKNNATIQNGGGFVRLRYPVYFERARYVSAVFKLETKQKQKNFHFTKAKCHNFIGIWNSLSDVT